MKITGTISEILTHKGRHVFTIAADATVFDVIRIMAEKNIGVLLVTDADGSLIGIVSERDYTRKVALKGKSSRETPVREIISSEIISVVLSDTVDDAMRLMTERRIRHLPVLDGGRIVGVVSIGDLVNWIISAQSQAIDQLENYITGQYPG